MNSLGWMRTMRGELGNRMERASVMARLVSMMVK